MPDSDKSRSWHSSLNPASGAARSKSQPVAVCLGLNGRSPNATSQLIQTSETGGGMGLPGQGPGPCIVPWPR
jgi:hypothetical protein